MSEANTIPALCLDADAIRHANDASQFNAGDVLVREAQMIYARHLSIFDPLPEWTPEQTAYAEHRAAEWRDLVQTAYNDLRPTTRHIVCKSVAKPK
jgi:hypothetical protein